MFAAEFAIKCKRLSWVGFMVVLLESRCCDPRVGAVFVSSLRILSVAKLALVYQKSFLKVYIWVNSDRARPIIMVLPVFG